MLLWKAVTIENCAACHVHSQGLCYMWIHVKPPLNINACPLPDFTNLVFVIQFDFCSMLRDRNGQEASVQGSERRLYSVKHKVQASTEWRSWAKTYLLAERTEPDNAPSLVELSTLYSGGEFTVRVSVVSRLKKPLPVLYSQSLTLL